ncbi:MAG TPA: sigma-54 dependent transcriptional regulator [Planctomycetota bacterium]|nr:sigma-54 dependent transcriptional regulator [Planctomycetota bacterium]
MDRQFSFLIVDDDESFRELCTRFLTSLGHKTAMSCDGQEALSMLRREWFDVALVDLRLPKLDGLQLVKIIKAEKPSPEVVILTGYGSISSAVEAMKLGAYDYVTKPFQLHEMELVISRLLRTKRLESENRMLKKRLDEVYRVEQFGSIIGTPEHIRGCIIGTTPRMQEIFAVIAAVSRNKSTVFIQGESGTGKELVAKAIHYQGPNAEKPFIAVNCSSMSKTLLESQLFGHVKGAFTGATMSTPGFFRAASGGTLFLDEICEIDVDLQAKLLRALQEREIIPLGSVQAVEIDTRVVAATNRNVQEALHDGKLREDLFYRLNVVSIEMPPLRERADDVPHLVRHFVQKYAREYDVAVKEVSPAAMEVLMKHDWPGNVRELENAIERAFALGETPVITVDDLPTSVRGRTAVQWKVSGKTVPSLEEAERSLIQMALEVAKGKKAVAARHLKIDRQRLYRKIRKYKLDPNLGKG